MQSNSTRLTTVCFVATGVEKDLAGATRVGQDLVEATRVGQDLVEGVCN